MTIAPIIRKARLQDLATIVNFNLSLVKEARGKDLDPTTLQKGVQAVLNDGDRGFYTVAEVEAKVVAAVLVTFEWSDFRNAWFWWLQDVYVEPNYRQQGVFRSLYQYLKDQATLSNVCGLRLYVYQDNARAQAVYQSLGMQPSDSLMYEEIL
ncbi:MAG: GNAT family N-acetyltransferase [Tildeniella nuda ZEHNDER 1965/U140]|jgi:GNAT superfamily N-acetyltransferase|nr:GNAT family N-acetyltransferase [Tildeniella nuda ZEHNDER 1965/U140]